MSPIVPAIIPDSLSDLQRACARVRPATHEVQVDIVDGVFVPFTSWPYNEGDVLNDISLLTDEFLIEMDLMIQGPELVVENYLKAGVRKVVIHIESTSAFSEIASLKSGYDFRLGLSCDNDTDIQKLYDVIPFADYVQCMGIANIGTQGQPFDTRVLERIQIIKEKYPNLIVSVDGSVNEDTLPLLARAGVDRCAVGSALLKAENFSETFARMKQLFIEHQ